MTFARTELIKFYVHHAGYSLKQAAAIVRDMTDAEVQAKREAIGQHTYHNHKNR